MDSNMFFPNLLRRELISMLQKFPGISLGSHASVPIPIKSTMVGGGDGGRRIGQRELEKNGLFGPLEPGDRYQMTRTGNRSSGQTCDNSLGADGNQPPGREAT